MTEVSQHNMIRPEEEKQLEMSTDLSVAHHEPTTDEIRGDETTMNGHAGEQAIPVNTSAEQTSPSEIATESHSSSAHLNSHAEAGRKGARCIHQLIQQGKLYEREHNLKPGRQRLRQLIEEGKLYEQELAPFPYPVNGKVFGRWLGPVTVGVTVPAVPRSGGSVQTASATSSMPSWP